MFILTCQACQSVLIVLVISASINHIFHLPIFAAASPYGYHIQLAYQMQWEQKTLMQHCTIRSTI